MELLRRLLEGLREKVPFLHDHALLALLGREERPRDADDVAEVELLEAGEHLLAQHIALEDHLEAVRAVIERREVHLAHAADHQQTARHADLLAFLERRPHILQVIMRKFVAVGRETEVGERLHRSQAVRAVFIHLLLFHESLLEKTAGIILFSPCFRNLQSSVFNLQSSIFNLQSSTFCAQPSPKPLRIED